MKIKQFLLAFLFVLVSCNDDETIVVDVESFLIKVDNIIISEVTEATLPVEIDFYGTVGPDGCHRFSFFETEFDDNDIIIKCWGIKNVDVNANCTANIVELNGERLSLFIDMPGQYFIRIIQPDGSEYVQELVVL